MISGSTAISGSSPHARLRPVLAAAGSFGAVLAIYSGDKPQPLGRALDGTNLSSVFVFAALVVCAVWVLRHASSSAWRWATGIAVVLATAQFVGVLLRTSSTLVAPLRRPSTRVWFAVHWLGTVWLAACAVAALIHVLDAYGRGGPDAGDDRDAGPSGVIGRLHRAARGSGRARRSSGLVLLGVLVVSRIPYLCVYWPGLVFFDTLRSYSYARGTGPWQSYEPVGNSLLVATYQGLGTHLGLGDAGGVAIASITSIVMSSAAFALLLVRMAVWGVPAGVWGAALAFLVLLPVLGYASVSVVKDVPFSIAMVFFMTCLAEIALGRGTSARRWWPWVGLAVAGVFALTTRNNGVHVLALTMPVLVVVLRHSWRRVLVVLGVLAAVFALYAGPLFAALAVQPGPKEEAFSVPLQQLGRIARYRAGSLSGPDRAFIIRTFDDRTPKDFAKHYVPGLADPMKLIARRSWADHTTGEFLGGWARVVAHHPLTAVTATLAGTQGYWDPQAGSYDGLYRWSSNDARGIHLDIPSGKPTTGVAGAIERSGIMPAHKYASGLQDDGYREVPLLGQAMSPSSACWLWVVGAVLVVRRRAWTALAVFVPIGASLVTFLAGPVSGGQRYSLTLFMTLPVAVAAVVVAARRTRPGPAAAG